ncbi:hypothetical protein BD779DRAFT_1760565 [Infundibulicybe gibba]|nr:hypothetical protein BD779DRAFT_1760565 [Infundibulicybe gibba]
MLFSLGFAALVLPTVLAAVTRGASIITVGSAQIEVNTIPASPEHLAMAKRLCIEPNREGAQACANIGPIPPISADCSALRDAIQELATSEQAPPYPCNLPSQASCPSFAVAPGYERTFTLRTCSIGFTNINPEGGPSVSYCNYLMAGVMPGLTAHTPYANAKSDSSTLKLSDAEADAASAEQRRNISIKIKLGLIHRTYLQGSNPTESEHQEKYRVGGLNSFSLGEFGENGNDVWTPMGTILANPHLVTRQS